MKISTLVVISAVIIGVIFLTPCVAEVNTDLDGPSVLLGYSEADFQKNPISSFMYFVPLIAPTLVDNISSADNEQQVGIISYQKKLSSKSFYLACEFKMFGNGFHKNTFDHQGMIALHIGELKKGQTLTGTLDYIKFEGEGFGRIEVRGTVDGASYTVTAVDVQFNAQGQKSPVTVGLYDVAPIDGQYKYENRSNMVVARVNTLSFKKTDAAPRMGIKVASVSSKDGKEGFFSAIKGLIANLIINPTGIDKLGNETMLNFGHALLDKESAFTFPKAKNIKETKIVIAD